MKSSFVSIKEAKQLTGLKEWAIRKQIREIILYGSKKEKKSVEKRKGKWYVDLRKVDKLAYREKQVIREESEKSRPVAPANPVSPIAHNQSYADILVNVLQEQLHSKDRQIGEIHNQMSTLLERNRELNVLLHNLQEQFATLGISSAQVPDHPIVETPADNLEETVFPSVQEELKGGPVKPASEARKFEEWLRSLQ